MYSHLTCGFFLLWPQNSVMAEDYKQESQGTRVITVDISRQRGDYVRSRSPG